MANFPFAVMVFVIWGIGLLVTACSVVDTNAALAGGGLFVTFMGGLLHGWSLCDS